MYGLISSGNVLFLGKTNCCSSSQQPNRSHASARHGGTCIINASLTHTLHLFNDASLPLWNPPDSCLFRKAFSKLESEVPRVVAVASAIMALVLVAISCVTGFIARSISIRITKPVNQLTEVVHALNNMDFSRQVDMCA